MYTTLRKLYYNNQKEMYQKHRFWSGCYKVGKKGRLGINLEMDPSEIWNDFVIFLELNN